jgi:hypothetical protein
MKTHNAGTFIYHCISCGRVVHAELDGEPPQCCGHAMTKACAETICEGDVAGEKAGGQSDTAPAVVKGRVKPR